MSSGVNCPHGIQVGTACLMCSMIANNTREVLVHVSPDGSIRYLPHDMDILEESAHVWRDSLSRDEAATHKKFNTYGGAVLIKMLKEDYDKLDIGLPPPTGAPKNVG